MAKTIIYHQEAHQKILSGVEKLAKTVAITMGPRGHNVLVGRTIGAPVLTKDGVSVAREVVLEDYLEEQGCQLVKEVAGRTADVAGDGTTTATILAHEILRRGQELVATGYSPIYFREGIKLGMQQILDNLEEIAVPVKNQEDLENIATISVNNDAELGSKIAEAFDYVGWDGAVAAEAKPGTEVTVRTVDGSELKSGYINPAFLAGEKSTTECVLDNCYILICDRPMTHVGDCIELLQQIGEKNKSILIMAKDVKQQALEMLATNKKRGLLNVMAIRHPNFGKTTSEWLQDVALSVSGKVASEENGSPLSGFTLDDLGFAQKVIVNKNATKIIGANRDEQKIQDRISKYKEDVLLPMGDLDRQDIQNRIMFLKNKIAVISVGYTTELELRQKSDRIEDAVFAVRAAISDGIVPGGGVALLRASQHLSCDEPKYLPALEVLQQSCLGPLRMIVENAEEDAEQVVAKILKSKKVNYGYDAANGEFGDLVEMGIVDPAKVTKTALTVAASIASLLIRTNAVIADIPNNPSGWQPPAGYRLPDPNDSKNHKF